jgi:hypothetical protein
MSAMVQAADLYVRQHGALKVQARPAGAADRPLSPQQLASNIVSLDAEWRDPQTLLVHLQILKGFHINSNTAAKDLVPTRLEVRDTTRSRDVQVDYPAGEAQQLAFSDEPLRVYEGRRH